MAKLYFRYGTVGSAKTLNLLAVAHTYAQQNKTAWIAKPALDTRWGVRNVRSRAGLERDADLILEPGQSLDPTGFGDVDCLLVDEAQFLTPELVDQLRALTRTANIPVICYGLRTDFRTRAFPGSQRLLELADAIEEIKTTCSHCTRKAVFNLKHRDGIPTVDGPTIDLGAEEKYVPVCDVCYHAEIERGREEIEIQRAALA